MTPAEQSLSLLQTPTPRKNDDNRKNDCNNKFLTDYYIRRTRGQTMRFLMMQTFDHKPGIVLEIKVTKSLGEIHG